MFNIPRPVENTKMLQRLRAHLRQFRRRPAYNHDGMTLYDRSVAFLKDPAFISAYQRGMDSGHQILRPAGSKADIHVEYRVYVECWAARHGLHLEGDLVCCGVNTGIMPLAICELINLDNTDRKFWLFDTYKGIPVEQISPAETARNKASENIMYPDCYETARKNFAPFKNAILVKGTVPDTLSTVDIERVCYLSIDMNIAYPERKAIEHFWPKLSSGAIVILDDYGFDHYIEQQRSMDEFARSVGVAVLALPTGQGMIVKP